MLPRGFRLSKQDEIKRALNGKRIKTDTFSLFFLKNNLEKSRFGFIISGKSVRSAVKRNLIKRRAREIIRKNLKKIKTGYDILFIFSQKSEGLNSKELEEKIFFELSAQRLLK